MNKEQAIIYLKSSGFSDEQIKAIEGAFTCDKCVYSTSDVLDHVRAEIDAARFLDKDKKLFKNANASGLEVAMDIIDKYKAESEVSE